MTTFNAQITASADDAREDIAGIVSTNGPTFLLDDAGDYLGLRYQNVTIPPGSAVSSAVITFYSDYTENTTPKVDIYCQDIDDAPAFTTANYDITSRSLTTAYANWDTTVSIPGTADTANFAAAVQEVIDRAGWASGNDLVVIIHALTGSSYRPHLYNNGTPRYSPIAITYTEPGAAGAKGKLAPIRLTSKVGGVLAQ